MSARSANLNNARSEATRARLINATVEALVDIGYANTTGVEVCRRAGVTRGALNHHFPVYVELLVAALRAVYAELRDASDAVAGPPLERSVRIGYQMTTHPRFKAVIELWLASRNDPEISELLTSAIAESAELFAPGVFLETSADAPQTRALYWTFFETLIGIGLGRATSGGQVPAHEQLVFDTLLRIANQHESSGDTDD